MKRFRRIRRPTIKSKRSQIGVNDRLLEYKCITPTQQKYLEKLILYKISSLK